MPIYARFGVVYGWLIDPLAHTLDAYALDAGAWREVGRFAGSGRMSMAPIDVSFAMVDSGEAGGECEHGGRHGNERQHQGPHEPQVSVIADTGDGQPAHDHHIGRRDRKSTRLNSSHT